MLSFHKLCMLLNASTLAGAVAVASVASAADGVSSVTSAEATVSKNAHHDSLQSFRAVAHRDTFSGIKPLRDLKRLPGFGKQQLVGFDVALQGAPTPDGRSPKAAIGLNFDGIGQGVYGFSVSSAPPDTSGAIGATQYVQIVNSSIAVFSKASGALLLGAAATNSLFKGFGGPCEANNDGDGSVRWDNLAKRWVITQFSVTPQTAPFYECVAVSKTADATGGYNRYAFKYTTFPDYPKFGVWPDAYYFTFNMFSASLLGAQVCAYDRTKMLAGLPATQHCFQLKPNYASLLPADPDGASSVAVGVSNYMLALDSNSKQLNLWKFHADFKTPAKTKLTGPIAIPVTPYTQACSGSGGTCIPQAGTTNQLDTLGDRLMFRLSYRLYSDGHEALLASHSVDTGGKVAVRWYEIRSPGTTPVVTQQGTYSPDTTFRWMPSIAQDKLGEFAIGYSTSSKKLHPGIRFATRTPTDALGTLSNETTILTGAGSQEGSLNRWGDYSGMTVDPADDCTFWYTNEYEKVTGSFNWNTRIANFKIAGCQ